MKIYTLKKNNIELNLNIDNNIIIDATSTSKDYLVKDFCSNITNLDIANAAYYGAKITYEKHFQEKSKISFVHNNSILKILDELLKKLFYENNFEDSFRYESEKLVDWNKQTNIEKENIINNLLNSFFKNNPNYEKNKCLKKLYNNMFEVNLSDFIEKNLINKTLIELEVFIRENLNIPVILSIQEIKDANKKRK